MVRASLLYGLDDWRRGEITARRNPRYADDLVKLSDLDH